MKWTTKLIILSSITSFAVGCGVCTPEPTTFELQPDPVRDITTIRLANTRGDPDTKLWIIEQPLWFDIAGVVRNLSTSTPCSIAVYLFEDEPMADDVAPLDGNDAPSESTSDMVLAWDLLPARDGDQPYTMAFSGEVSNTGPFESWLVITGCMDVPIEIEVEGYAAECPPRKDPDDYRVTFEHES